MSKVFLIHCQYKINQLRDTKTVILCSILNDELNACGENSSKIEVNSIKTGDATIMEVMI